MLILEYLRTTLDLLVLGCLDTKNLTISVTLEKSEGVRSLHSLALVLT